MLTLFTMPKKWDGHIKTIQRNALISWKNICNDWEIILFGDEQGTADTAKEFGVHHKLNVDANEKGTPIVSSIFQRAQQSASHDLFVYVNADIILFNDFKTAIEKVQSNFYGCDFLMVGRRRNMEITSEIEPDETLYKQAKEVKPFHHGALDYFVFTRGMLDNMPPFAIGRSRWDNWIVGEALINHIPVIDATEDVVAIHQNHDYTGLTFKYDRKAWKQGPEIQQNQRLYGQYFRDHPKLKQRAGCDYHSHYLKEGELHLR